MGKAVHPATGGGGSAVVGAGGSGTGVVAAGQGLFPATAPWYQDISQAALDAKSGDVISGLSMAGGWGNGDKFQIDSSIEVLAADASVARRAFMTTGDFYDPDCDKVDVPVPPGGRLEGESDYACASDGDCHLIVVQGIAPLRDVARQHDGRRRDGRIRRRLSRGLGFDQGLLGRKRSSQLSRAEINARAPTPPAIRSRLCSFRPTR